MTEPFSIPAHGRAHADVLAEMDALAGEDADWRSGHTWSLVYHAGEEHTAFLKQAYTRFFSENGLNPIAFQSLRRMEAEVVAMTASMLNGGTTAAGTMTSGGSESIFMACKTYRTRARAERPEVTAPNIVAPLSAHPAFDKACYYLGLELRKVDVGPDLRADVAAMAAAADDQTIALVGSAPGYPHGVVDPIEDLGALALERGIWLHVDGCLGGFLLPWLERAGVALPPWDFRVPGVTSISADVHKYGFASKGASTITYRDATFRRHQFFAATGWPGGIYASPSASGTRPGGAIAAAWAAMQAIGEDGYTDMARRILATATTIREGVRAIDGLRILGDPPASVFAFTSDDVDIYVVGDQLDARGWHMDRQILPASLHVMVTPAHEHVAEAFLADLAASVDHARAHPEDAQAGQAAMYGMMASLPAGQEQQVEDFVLTMLDGLYQL